ncbi:MAG TPA: type 4a pilus biogenesis protein PilO [Candidatus Eremiobacteraceae bacterium]|nr:type 4a pilus biogenesis protein PilO [Candidatus Eremiobacteraceae bacterium]
MNQEQNNLNRILIVAGVLALVAIGAYFMVVQPKLQQVAQSKAQLANLQSQYSALKQVADQKPMYLALIRQVQSRLSGVELSADPRAYIPSYLKQIEDLAKRDGLVVTAVVPQATSTPAPGATPTPVPTGAAALSNAPLIGGTVGRAGKALGASNAQAQAENNQMPQGAAPIAGATPVPGAPAGAPVKAPATTSPRVNAQVYLSQSFEEVPINMELSGSYTDLQRFLRDLNKFPKLLGLGSVTLTSAHAGVGETPKLHIVLPIVAYRLSPNGPLRAATPPPAANGG